jgi:hypothetical protein
MDGPWQTVLMTADTTAVVPMVSETGFFTVLGILQ